MATDSKDCVDLGHASLVPLIQDVQVLQRRGPIHVLKANLSGAGQAWLEGGLCPLVDKDKPVLVKFVQRVKSEHDPSFQAAMKMEIDVLRDLPPSPLLNRLLCCMKTLKDGVYSYWMVSEYLDAPDMFRWLIHSEDCKGEEGFAACTQNGPCIFWLAFLTLGVLHKHGIYHRDVKLENFILRKPVDIEGFPPLETFMPPGFLPPSPAQNARAIPTLIDFGAACVWPRSAASPLFDTCTKTRVGTPATADPWLADHKLNPFVLEMADYFSLVIVMCMVYTKRKLMWEGVLPNKTKKPLLSLSLLRRAPGKREPLLFAAMPPKLKEIAIRTLALGKLQLVHEKFFLSDVMLYYEATSNEEPFTLKSLTSEDVVARVSSSLEINIDKIYIDISMVPRFRIQPKDISGILGIGEDSEKLLFP